MHPRNRNRELYNIDALVDVNPLLSKYIKANRSGTGSIDFSNAAAVKALNKSLLSCYYKIEFWDFPDNNLCPPIPGRADYIHHVADLLSESNFGVIPIGESVTCLDIGTGASCIYPIIGAVEYNWNFICSDIEPKSIKCANIIVNKNSALKNRIECRLQVNSKNIFTGIIGAQEKIDLSLCNPPFHSSVEDAHRGTRRKIKNLSGKRENKPTINRDNNPTLNFAGVHNELIYEGGEYEFIQNMIKESKSFAKNCFWFTTLVSKQSNLRGIYKLLESVEARQVVTKPMGTANKSTRIVAWTFLSKEEQKEWAQTRWLTDNRVAK